MDNSAQRAYWNEIAGPKWVREADRLDAMLSGINRVVLDAAKIGAGERVVDVGCGAGSLSLLAAQTAPGVKVTGVDLSKPLTDLARTRAEKSNAAVEFILADASEWRAPEVQDVLISRFGVMFFAEPVAAFANLRASLRKGGRLAFACWRPFVENAWAFEPFQAAMSLLEAPSVPPDPHAPGPFAFADGARVKQILSDAGWNRIELQNWDGDLILPGGTIADTAEFMLEIGPLGRLIVEQKADKEAIKSLLMTAFSPIDGSARVVLPGAVWIVTASA